MVLQMFDKAWHRLVRIEPGLPLSSPAGNLSCLLAITLLNAHGAQCYLLTSHRAIPSITEKDVGDFTDKAVQPQKAGLEAQPEEAGRNGTGGNDQERRIGGRGVICPWAGQVCGRLKPRGGKAGNLLVCGGTRPRENHPSDRRLKSERRREKRNIRNPTGIQAGSVSVVLGVLPCYVLRSRREADQLLLPIHFAANSETFSG